MEEKKQDSGFDIKEKRHSGESAEAQNQTREDVKTAANEEKQQSQAATGSAQDNEQHYPLVNFTNFVLSLSTSALFHFGDFPETEGGKPEKNLPAAKQTIDILDMLHEKTKGNLDKNESDLIQGVLYELKMRYVKEKA
jgi:hypothetical protein